MIYENFEKLSHINKSKLNKAGKGPHFLCVYRRNKPARDVGRRREKLANQELEANDFQAFSFFFFYKTYVSSSMECHDKIWFFMQ